MLPSLSFDAGIEPIYRMFLDRLAENGFRGDIERDYASRLTGATDNSVFQQIPQAILHPCDENDIARIFALAATQEFACIAIAPRGGGTSTIGCSLTTGLVLDCSRHMNEIVAMDIEAGWVRVQPGVVLDQLNDTLAEYGTFFAPNVAPSSRATLGGMANTDGCGKGSRVYGKTSDHVLATRLILPDGSQHVTESCSPEQLAALNAREDGIGYIHREVTAAVNENADEIERVFPTLSRYLSGYNLAQLFDADGRFHLNKLICGSEGTLAVITELTLRVVPIPDKQTLFALRYDSFESALRDAHNLVAFEPTAIETVDEQVMGLARDNPIYERVRDMIENTDGSTPSAVNLVEFSATEESILRQAVSNFESALDTNSSVGAIGCYRAETAEAITALWDLRKAGVGLLGSTPGERKPLPFVEDTVVPPDVLADYVQDFRAILDEYGLTYGMFGHVDVGCLHVRPALNLCDPDDERIMREITGRVEALVRSYDGMLWNEHGKGFRSGYNPEYFGPRLYAALVRIKRAFDPGCRLNPGKIVALADQGVSLATMDTTTRGGFNREIPSDTRAAFAGTIDCNGNGACFDYDPSDIMCPSYRATRDRLHSPKGRADAMREWLRRVKAAGFDPSRAPIQSNRPLWLAGLIDAGRAFHQQTPDFSHQVWTAMDGCLSCRACATQCPVKVDVPNFKTSFLAMYHQRYRRPLSDYVFAYLEPTAPWLAMAPRWANALAARRPARKFLSRVVGLSDPPKLSNPSLPQYLRQHPEYYFTPDSFEVLDAAVRSKTVFIVQDVFTSFFDAEVVIDVLSLLERLGYHPRALPFHANGKPLQVKGFSTAFERTARSMADFLRDVAGYGCPLVGLEPSVTLSYREEYPAMLGAYAVPDVQPIEEWLADTLPTTLSSHAAMKATRYTLFQHCTAATVGAGSTNAWTKVFARLGLRLSRTSVGCCGMSGAYGHETRHQTESRTIFDLSWGPSYAQADAIPVVPGYSCRSQLKRFGGYNPLHPVQALLATPLCIERPNGRNAW